MCFQCYVNPWMYLEVWFEIRTLLLCFKEKGKNSVVLNPSCVLKPFESLLKNTSAPAPPQNNQRRIFSDDSKHGATVENYRVNVDFRYS